MCALELFKITLNYLFWTLDVCEAQKTACGSRAWFKIISKCTNKGNN